MRTAGGRLLGAVASLALVLALTLRPTAAADAGARAEAAAERAEAAATRAEAAAERTERAVERLERILDEVEKSQRPRPTPRTER
jgi:hypothetical protein